MSLMMKMGIFVLTVIAAMIGLGVSNRKTPDYYNPQPQTVPMQPVVYPNGTIATDQYGRPILEPQPQAGPPKTANPVYVFAWSFGITEFVFMVMLAFIHQYDY
jgi:hypothetical protein